MVVDYCCTVRLGRRGDTAPKRQVSPTLTYMEITAYRLLKSRVVLIESCAIHGRIKVRIWLWRRLEGFKRGRGRDFGIVSLAEVRAQGFSVSVSREVRSPSSYRLVLERTLEHQPQASPECEHLDGRESCLTILVSTSVWRPLHRESV